MPDRRGRRRAGASAASVTRQPEVAVEAAQVAGRRDDGQPQRVVAEQVAGQALDVVGRHRARPRPAPRRASGRGRGAPPARRSTTRGGGCPPSAARARPKVAPWPSPARPSGPARRAAGRARRGSPRGPPAGSAGSTPAETSSAPGVGVLDDARATRRRRGPRSSRTDRNRRLHIPSPRTALSTRASRRPDGRGGARARRGPAAPGSCARLPSEERAGRPAARAPARSRGSTPLPGPNAAAASATASSWSRSPATATTVFAGRYVVRQKSRIVSRRQGADAGLVAADLAAQRAVAEHRLLEQDLGVLGRVVEVASGSPRR